MRGNKAFVVLVLISCAVILRYFVYCGEEENFGYKTYKEINDFLLEISYGNKEIVKHVTIGHSVEGRNINGIQINRGNTRKPTIFLDAGLHAREWIGPVVALYIVEQLLGNPDYSNLTEKLNWYILPMLNPDGYVFSMESIKGRLWRKNRARTFNPICDGVDLNRNFGFIWGGPGSSDDPCQENYRGPFPFSEPEAEAFAKFFLSKKQEIKMYLTLHSSAQAILYPWGYTEFVPPDWEKLDSLAKRAMIEIAKVNGTKYAVGPTTHLVGIGAGGSDDWAKGSAGIKYVYTIELPGPKYPESGFNPPASSHPGISKEVFEGIKVLAEEIIAENPQDTSIDVDRLPTY